MEEVRAFLQFAAPLSLARPVEKNRSRHTWSILLSKLSSALFYTLFGVMPTSQSLGVSSRPLNHASPSSSKKGVGICQVSCPFRICDRPSSPHVSVTQTAHPPNRNNANAFQLGTFHL